MSDTNQIQDLLDRVPGAGRSGGKYLDRLTPESVEVLDLFQQWLMEDPAEGKTASTAAAYKGYVAQALCHIQDGGDVQELSTDVRSGINALKRFHSSDVGAILRGDDEDGADDGDQLDDEVGNPDE